MKVKKKNILLTLNLNYFDLFIKIKVIKIISYLINLKFTFI